MLDLQFETVETSLRDRVATITLNRPESLNAFVPEMGRELLAVLDHVAGDGEIRALVLTGAGRAFSSGADLKRVASWGSDGKPELLTPLREVFHPLIMLLRTIEKPVVAAVNGAAAGIGCSLALACDLIMAAESSFFGLAFVNVGLMPDGGSTAFVPPAVGRARAFQMALLGERIPAPQALEWGLVNWVYPDDRLMDEADSLVERLAAGPTRSYASSKRALNQFIYGDLDAQLELEAELQHALGRTKDFFEGAAAFVQKRAPAFTGG
jgi:2-(1,2-epoxy-1,2-dihydrophenyl)acetyl-CoA isomerase